MCIVDFVWYQIFTGCQGLFTSVALFLLSWPEFNSNLVATVFLIQFRRNDEGISQEHSYLWLQANGVISKEDALSEDVAYIRHTREEAEGKEEVHLWDESLTISQLSLHPRSWQTVEEAEMRPYDVAPGASFQTGIGNYSALHIPYCSIVLAIT